MSEKKFALTRRRLLAGLGTVGAASAAAGAGTFAYFSDTESSTGNTVSAGTLDLEPNSESIATFDVGPIAPGNEAGSLSIGLNNTGSVAGHHLEFVASISGNGGESAEPADTDFDAEVSSEDFAKRVFADSLTYNGTPVNWSGSSLATLVDNPGAVVIDNMELNRVSDPAGGGREGVLQALGTGYGISMRNVSSLELGNVGTGDVTLDWYGGSTNIDSAPDEIFAVINDGGTRHLIYHTANYGSNSNDDNGQTWRTLDIGQEMGLAGSASDAYNTNFNWEEIAPNQGTVYPDPSTGLTGDPANDGEATASFSSSATVEALGFGVGSFRSAKQKEVYYDDLSVAGTTYEFRPLTLYDLAKRGVADKLAGLPADGTTRTFNADFSFDPMAGNDYQADGVTVDFQFGLAQESGQDVL